MSRLTVTERGMKEQRGVLPVRPRNKNGRKVVHVKRVRCRVMRCKHTTPPSAVEDRTGGTSHATIVKSTPTSLKKEHRYANIVRTRMRVHRFLSAITTAITRSEHFLLDVIV